MSGYQYETPEQTLERLHRGQASGANTDSGPSGVYSPAAERYFPVPNVNPVATYQVYARGWAPDALVFLHPELFTARVPAADPDHDRDVMVSNAQIQVEVAVFALAAAGLIRLWVRRSPLDFIDRFAVVIQPVDGLAYDDISPPIRPAWVSDLILEKVYRTGRLPAWGARSLVGLQGRSAAAAVQSGMATRQGRAIVRDPGSVEASSSAARTLSRRWTVFTCDYTRLHLSLRRARTAPASSGGG